uniref:PAP-associated domain-containing protein n=1 Tax=Meloidogyne incognita TaxID=6306 RepID=A0A914MZ38_MELIC
MFWINWGFHFENIHVLDKTAFPLVKCTDQLTQLNIDINFNINGRIDRTVGWIRDKLDFMPHLEPLLLVLKLFLAQRGLNNPYTGGLPSYALVVMLVHYLEYIRLKNKSDVSHKDSYNYMTLIGRKPLGLLLHYFFFYFYCFDYSEMGIKVRNRVSASLVLHKKELIEELGEEIFYSSPVFICDPCERGNNLGRSAHNILTIRQAFYDAFRTIGTTLNHCNQLSPYIKKFILWSIIEVTYQRRTSKWAKTQYLQVARIAFWFLPRSSKFYFVIG